MKQKHLALSVALLLSLASCAIQAPSTSTASGQSCPACEPCSSQEATKRIYGHYTLKDSVTDLAEIEGYPWINSSIAGMLGKVEKPEAKHDFFGHANYEDFLNNPLPKDAERAGGKIMESKSVTDGHILEIMNSDNASVQAVLQMLKTGAKGKIRAEVADLLNPEKAAASASAILSSKALFEGASRLVNVEIDEAGKIHVSFVLNLDSVTLPLICYLAASTGKVQSYIDAFVAYLKLIGFEEGSAGTLYNAVASAIIPAILAQAQAGIEPHETTIGQMDYDFGSIDFKAALLDLGLPAETKVTMSDQAYRVLAAYGGMNLETLANVLALSRMFDNRFCVGAADFRDLATKYFKDLQGLSFDDIDENSSDEQVAQALYVKAFPKAFDQVYIDKFIKPSTKQRIDNLIGDIIGEYQALFEQQDWLSDETKLAAKDKLANMWHMSFYSDGFMDANNLFKVTATDALTLAADYYQWYTGIMTSCPWSGNILACTNSTTTVNAMYSPNNNAFAIYHGVCAAYVEDENLSTEELYGYIGMSIGHEISHGFDSTGANFDKIGQKHDWWNAEDRAAFQDKVNKIAKYYTESVHGYHDHNYNGPNLTGEVIADMGGTKVMLCLAKKQESFDYDKFFRAIARNFAIQETRQRGVARIGFDVHPEEHLRINVTLGQFEEFTQTYGVKEGDGMYVAPEKRLAIW